MGQPTNTFDTYDAKGIREDLANVIYNISPEETPFMSNIGKGTAKSTYFEWQEDALAAASLSNAQIEGDDAVAVEPTPTVRMGNYTQISRKTVSVSGSLEAVDKAGRKSEMAYQMAKSASELKRDMELTMVSGQAAVAGNSSTARKSAGLGAFLRTNTDNGATATNPTLSGTTSGYPNAAAGAGTPRAWSETILKNVQAKVWANGGNAKMLLVGSTLKQKASAFPGIAAQRYNASGAKQSTIVGAADIYVTDFGNLEIVPSRFIAADVAYHIDTSMASVCFLRPFEKINLAKTGDADRMLLVTEWGLKVHNEKAHGVARDLT